MATTDYLAQCIEEYRRQQRQGRPLRRHSAPVYVYVPVRYPYPVRYPLPMPPIKVSPPIYQQPGPVRVQPNDLPPGWPTGGIKPPPQITPVQGVKPVKMPPVLPIKMFGGNSGTLSDLACGCDDQTTVNVEGSEFKLDPIFKWGVLAALAFIAIKA